MRGRLVAVVLTLGGLALLSPLGFYAMRSNLALAWIFGLWTVLVVLAFFANRGQRGP